LIVATLNRMNKSAFQEKSRFSRHFAISTDAARASP
jgi:hypothetical protein